MVRIVEVGPRDGLQNEKAPIPTASKAAFVEALADSGLRDIEAASFVSPKWVPQLGDAEGVLGSLRARPDVRYSAVVPNLRGLERALAAGVRRISVLTSASEAFQKANTNTDIEGSLAIVREVVDAFRAQVGEGGWVRCYLSTAFECPYTGLVDPSTVVRVAARLAELRLDEVSVSDTIGVACPREVRSLGKALLDALPRDRIAFHFHDTRGTAIANVAAALELGFEAFDACAGGLGGCPYAPGAGGNLATEDLVYFLERSGVQTGVDLRKLARASLPIMELLGRAPTAKTQVAELASCVR